VQRDLDGVVGRLWRGPGRGGARRGLGLDAGPLGHAQHLERAGAVGQAPQELALLERADQAVDAGLRLEVQRLLHLLERGRYAGFGEAIVDEADQLVLLGGEHRGSSQGTDTERL